MENDNLDDFISNNPVEKNNFQSQSPEISSRPKLRKIKRPKIRPLTERPSAPEKIMPPTAFSDTERAENTETANLSLSDMITDESNTAEEQTVSDFTSLPDTSGDSGSATGTDIIKASDEKNISSGSSYILSNLPPELDDFNGEDEYIDDEISDTGDYVRKKFIYVAATVFFIIGIIFGRVLFSTKEVEKHGLEGIVTNPDVPAGRPRCGLTDKSQACVFYLMNWYKQELNGRDFYKLAAQLTGREEYMIETDNLRYATVKIKPGHIAQLNIPALK